MYRTVFELIRKDSSGQRWVDDICDCGKKNRFALFEERGRN